MTDISKEAVERLAGAAPFADAYHGIPEMVRMIHAQSARIEELEAQVAAARNTEPDHPMRDKVARIITLDHLDLLSDFDVDGDIYRTDPECAASAYATADAILALMEEPTND